MKAVSFSAIQICNIIPSKQMRKKTNISICHIENYVQTQKVNCILKIRFNNDELTPGREKIKTLHMIETKGQ